MYHAAEIEGGRIARIEDYVERREAMKSAGSLIEDE
jgi:hypothetical protein